MNAKLVIHDEQWPEIERALGNQIQRANRERARNLGAGVERNKQILEDGNYAKECLVRSYAQVVMAKLGRYKKLVETQDCFQEVLTDLFASVDRFDPAKGRFSTFAFPIIKKSIFAFLKREGYLSRKDGPLGWMLNGSADLKGASGDAAPDGMGSESEVTSLAREPRPQRVRVSPKPKRSVYPTRLARHMAQLGMTDEELARKTGRSVRTIERWCAGSDLPRDPRDKDALERIFAGLCHVDHLFDADVVAEVIREHGSGRDRERPYGDEYFPQEGAPSDADLVNFESADDDDWLKRAATYEDAAEMTNEFEYEGVD